MAVIKNTGAGEMVQQLTALTALAEDPHGHSQPPITPGLGDPTPFSGHHSHCTH